MKKQKLFTGKPKLCEGWSPVGLTEEVFGTRWFIAVQDGDAKWRNIKISAYDKGVPFKANYWTAWSDEEQRLADSRDFKSMQDHRPGLVFAVECKMEEAAERGLI